MATVDTDLAFASALEQARLVRTKQVAPLELTELYLSRIDALNDRIGAYITVAADHALDAAKRATERPSDAPFHGVPISVKDLSNTAGIRTTHGCAAWSDRIPEADDEHVARLRRAGFVFLGKTVVPELGPVNVSEPPGYPPGRNPWNPELSCGGSSGGAAASIASGLAPIAHGSDGGGSIRNPASWCGVFGIKPSRGRITDAPRTQQFFSVQGPLSRSVADAAALLDVMAGPASGDPFWAPPPSRPFVEEATIQPGRLRVAITTRATGPVPIEVDPAWEAAAREAASLLQQLGHTVEEVDPPDIGDALLGAMSLMFFANYAARSSELPPLDTLTNWSRTMIEMGRGVTASAYIAAQDQLIAASRTVIALFDTFDVLLTPTTAKPPPPVGTFADLDISNVPLLWSYTPFTGMWNTTGQPAVQIPWSIDDRGLPTGVQLVGRPADEATLIRLSTQIEDAHPWASWRPPLT